MLEIVILLILFIIFWRILDKFPIPEEKERYTFYTWVTVALIIISIISSVYSYMSQKAKARKLKRQMEDALKSLKQSGYLSNTKTSSEPLKVVYGNFRVGGNKVFEAWTGENNELYHFVMTLSEGPIEGIDTDAQGPMIWLDEKRWQEFGDLVYYELFSGSKDQPVCDSLRYYAPQWNDRLMYCSYIYVILKYNENFFMGIPEITVQLKGRKLYDPRLESSGTDSGDSLEVWTNNGALVWMDWMTNKRYSSPNITPDLIDIQSVIDAANKLDDMGYTFNGAVYMQKAFLDNLSDIEANIRAATIWSQGKYRLMIFDYDVPVMHLTDDDIVDKSFTYALPGIPETPNRVEFTFPNKDAKYQATTDYIADPTTILSYDKEERDSQLELIGTDNITQAKGISTHYLERERLNKSYSFIAHIRAAALEQGDMIQVTYKRVGWVANVVRVEAVGLPQAQQVMLTVGEETANLYNSVVDVSPHTFFTSTFPDPKQKPPPCGNVIITEEIATNKNLTYSRLKVVFDRPGWVWWHHAEVYTSIDNGATWKQRSDSFGTFNIDPAEQGKTYLIKLVSVSIYGAKENIDDVPIWGKDVAGKNLPPPNVTGFVSVVASDQVNLKWDEVVDIDIAGYEIRRGDSFSTGLFVYFTKSLTATLAAMKPGTHRLWIAAKDTTGSYSTGPAYTDVIIIYPAGYSQKYSWATNFSDGTHNGTNYEDHSTYGRVLFVDDSSNIGDWTSPVHDMGSIKNMRFWENNDYLVMGDETAWTGKFESTEQWIKYNDIWSLIFSSSRPSRYSIELFYSEDNSIWKSISFFELYSAEVTARYVSFKITIHNVSDNNYLFIQPITLIGAYWQ